MPINESQSSLACTGASNLRKAASAKAPSGQRIPNGASGGGEFGLPADDEQMPGILGVYLSLFVNG
jgi:hypothetical protein